MGVATSRNTAWDNATGDIICVMDSDDMSMEQRAEIAVAYFKKHPSVSLMYGHCAILNGMGVQVAEIKAKDMCVSDMKQLNTIPHPALSYRHNIPVKYRPKTNYIDDWYFLMDCINAGLQFGWVDTTIGVYRPLATGLTLAGGMITPAKEKLRDKLRAEFKDFDDDLDVKIKTDKMQKVRVKKILAAVKPDTSVCDLGCNSGTIIKKLIEKKGCTVCGVDSASNLVKACRAVGLEVRRWDIRKPLCFGTKKFDYVLLCDVLEHFEKKEIAKILKNAHDIARREVIITVPYKHGPYSAENLKEHKLDLDAQVLSEIYGGMEYTETPIMFDRYATPVWLMVKAK